MLWSLRQKQNTQREEVIQLGNNINIYLFTEILYAIIPWVKMCITGNQKGEFIKTFMNSFLPLFQSLII